MLEEFHEWLDNEGYSVTKSKDIVNANGTTIGRLSKGSFYISGD